jgi:hypothetical protein
VHCRNRHDHYREHQRRADRAEQPAGDQQSAGNLSHPGERRERLAGLEAELLEEATGAREPVAAEPAKHLLGAVRRHHQPEHQSNHQQP